MILYETVLAGCTLKAEEMDDSSGGFGDFSHEVVLHWIGARQKACAAPAETAARLLHWISDDPYGFCSGLQKQLGAVLTTAGLAALESLVEKRGEADPADRRWPSLLRQIYIHQNRSADYERLAGKAGYPAEDCLALARMHAETDPATALRWIERVASDSAVHYAAPPLRRELLDRLGRREEALASAWQEYLRSASKYRLDEVLRHATAEEQDVWRAKAFGQAKGDLQTVMELYVDLGERERLATLTEAALDTDLEGLSHRVTEPAATLLEASDPFLAARLWRAQALRIVNGGKSKAYDAAIDNLERARDCFRRAGREAEWEKTAREPVMRLWFLELATAKWQQRRTR